MISFKRLIHTVDAHTAGEPLRIITSGLPLIPGDTILEKRRHMLAHYDHFRTLLMLEPRGHSGMYGCLITPPVRPDADFGVIFMHNEGYSTMCGHGIIAVVKAAAEIGLIETQEGENLVLIDAPAGRITARLAVDQGRAGSVSFDNVPSFVYARKVPVDLDGPGRVLVDIAFGGAFYAYVMAGDLGVEVNTEQIDRLVELGEEIKHRVMEQMEVVHPLEPDLCGIYGTIICEPTVPSPEGEGGLVSKNVCIFADAQIDRSPTGTGTSGRLALLHDRGLLGPGMIFTNKSVIDTVFWGRVKETCRVGDFEAVITEVGGEAHIMGFHQFVLEPKDPLALGFRITGG